jgi:hypothetical protein
VKGRNAEVLLERFESKGATQELVLVLRTSSINELAQLLDAGGRDTARLLIACAHSARLQAIACSTCGQRRPISRLEAAGYIFGGWPACRNGHKMERLVTVQEARGTSS